MHLPRRKVSSTVKTFESQQILEDDESRASARTRCGVIGIFNEWRALQRPEMTMTGTRTEVAVAVGQTMFRP